MENKESRYGMDTRMYGRGVIFMFLAAVAKRYGMAEAAEVRVEHSLNGAIYCEGEVLTPETIPEIERAMQAYVAADLPFEKRTVRTKEARQEFLARGMEDKAMLLRFRRTGKTTVYALDGYLDYCYGRMPESTGCLSVFALAAYGNGCIVLLEDSRQTGQPARFRETKKLYETLQESNRWYQTMGVSHVGELNRAIAEGSIERLMLLQEALCERTIAELARYISEHARCRFVLIAGPSSSGKTTFSHRLSIQLASIGMKPHPIALDNYYVDRVKTPRDADGNYDFECLEALNVELFQTQMQQLLRGERVQLPVYDFETGVSSMQGEWLQLGERDCLVIEGIHGLNERLTGVLPRESKYKIYISALSQLNIDRHNRIPTTDGRLLRRIVRDARTRATSAEQTIAMWASVRRGEEKNIFPYQEEADVMFNSALIYELAVLKQYVEPLLYGIPETSPYYEEALRLLKFLDFFLGIPAEKVPGHSILREFIGGGIFLN